jgi:hypothetical protein
MLGNKKWDLLFTTLSGQMPTLLDPNKPGQYIRMRMTFLGTQVKQWELIPGQEKSGLVNRQRRLFFNGNHKAP